MSTTYGSSEWEEDLNEDSIFEIILDYIDYAKFVIRHKWYVYQECRKLGLGFWQSFVHDFSKFSSHEFRAYANKFNRFLKTDQAKREFDIAWLHHIHLNPHHWQHWILTTDSEGVKVIRMPEKYVKEMVADWRGVALARGEPAGEATNWYLKNKDTLSLHPQTRSRIEVMLGIKTYDSYVQIVHYPTPRQAGS